MALQVDIVSDYGVPINYFKIVGLDLNVTLKKAKIKLVGYYNEEARLDDSKTLFIKDYNVIPTDYNMYFSTSVLNEVDVNPISKGYEFIKLNDEKFTNATDC